MMALLASTKKRSATSFPLTTDEPDYISAYDWHKHPIDPVDEGSV
jgi:hypothetical protein